MEERWFDEELSGCRLGDGRLDRRLHQLVERMEVGFGESIPLACQDWASTKAAYRFFSNERVSEEDILRGHFDATRRRFAASDGPILVLHDTTEFTYKRKRTEAVGFTTKVSSGKDKRGRERMHAVCGLLMHSSLAVTTDGLPLGIAAAKFWTRKKFKGTNALKRKINPTRVPIEGKESMRWLENLRQSTELLGDPARCVHICDREGDIWELFCLAREMDTHFVIRRFANRLAEDGSRTVEAIMTDEKVRGLHRVAVRDDKGRLGSTQVELSYRRMTVRPPIAKQKRYPTLMLTVLHAREPAQLWVGPPPTVRNQPPPQELEQMQHIARKFDVAGRDERNRALGRAGERLVLSRERGVLSGAGREDLAHNVRWVSEEDGDGAGYDISSFAPDGQPRLIEVKTTNGWERTPFHISRNELAVADHRRADWHLFRLWNFSREPKAFELQPPLDPHVLLTPTNFQASFR